eukprot:9477086-Pyramimonas_sp.AAC.1
MSASVPRSKMDPLSWPWHLTWGGRGERQARGSTDVRQELIDDHASVVPGFPGDGDLRDVVTHGGAATAAPPLATGGSEGESSSGWKCPGTAAIAAGLVLNVRDRVVLILLEAPVEQR